GKVCPEDARSRYDDLKRDGIISTIGFAVGGVGTLAGLYFALTSRGEAVRGSVGGYSDGTSNGGRGQVLSGNTRRINRAVSLFFGMCAAGCHLILGANDFSFGSADGGGDAGEGGGFEAGGVDDPTKPSSLRFTMRDMGVHFNQLIEFRIIDNQNT